MPKHKYTKGQIVYVLNLYPLEVLKCIYDEAHKHKKRQYWVWTETGKWICVYGVMIYTSEEEAKAALEFRRNHPPVWRDKDSN